MNKDLEAAFSSWQDDDLRTLSYLSYSLVQQRAFEELIELDVRRIDLLRRAVEIAGDFEIGIFGKSWPLKSFIN